MPWVSIGRPSVGTPFSPHRSVRHGSLGPGGCCCSRSGSTKGLRERQCDPHLPPLQKPHVRPGGRYRCHPIGVLEVDAIRIGTGATSTRRTRSPPGSAASASSFAHLATGPGGTLSTDGELFRIDLHYGGDGDRVEIALDDRLTAEDIARIRERLERLDARTPWTRKTLDLLSGIPAWRLPGFGRPPGPRDGSLQGRCAQAQAVRTSQSFEAGIEISPRGRAYLAAVRARCPRRGGSGRGLPSRRK